MTRRAVQPALPLVVPAMPPAVRAELRAQIVPGWGQQGGVRLAERRSGLVARPGRRRASQTSPGASAPTARSAGPASPTPSRWVSRTASGAASMRPNGSGCGSPWPRARAVAAVLDPVTPDGGGLMSLAVLADITTRHGPRDSPSTPACASGR